MVEYICVQGHCPCGHFCVRSPMFEKMLEENKINTCALILDPLIHRFEEKNHFFLENSNVFEVSEEEMLRLVDE